MKGNKMKIRFNWDINKIKMRIINSIKNKVISFSDFFYKSNLKYENKTIIYKKNILILF